MEMASTHHHLNEEKETYTKVSMCMFKLMWDDRVSIIYINIKSAKHEIIFLVSLHGKYL